MQRRTAKSLTPSRLLHNVALPATALVVWLSIGVCLCHAQVATTATITGTIADQSGAVLPHAAITITNTDTGTVTQTTTNSAGTFSRPGLPVGHYEVTVSNPGFATYEEAGIYLGPAAVYTVRAKLKPAAVTTSVTVHSTQVQTQTTTSEISATVSGQDVQELPLNGRNYQGLGSLMPGVINTSPIAQMGTGGFNTSNALNVNGGGSSGSLYTLDGIWNENTGNMTQTTIMPNPDEIEEVKVLQSNYEAKYSLMGASVVMVQTKSGTDTFHGGAWEFLRNTALDSRNYFATTIPTEQSNIFGWNLGGPLFIPHVYNPAPHKTFFYLNQQWVRQKQASVQNGATPIAAMRGIGTSNGDAVFPTSGPYASVVKDPVTGQPFSNNTIPATRINQSNLAYLNALAPLPNNQTGAFNNYLNTNPAITNQGDITAKVDHNFSSRLRLTAEYFYEGQHSSFSSAQRMGSPFTTNYDLFKEDNQLAQVQLTHVISSYMTNQISVAMNNYIIDHDFGGVHLLSQVSGFHENLPYTGGYLQNYLPHVSFSGGWSQMGTSSNNIIPRATDLEDTLTDNWSWLRGKHFIEAGGTLLFGTKRQWTTSGAITQGNFSFNGQFTGNPIADFLLGDSNSFSQSSTGLRKYIHYPIYTPYVQDQWKATRHLTINAGIRYLYMPFPNQQVGYLVDFNPALFNPANAPIVSTNGILTATPTYNPINGLIFNGKNGVPVNLTSAHHNYWAPTVGFALDVFGDGRTALRGGYGITYNRNNGMGESCAQGCTSYPVIQETDLINTNFPSPVGAGSAPAPTAVGISGMDLVNAQVARIQSYSVSLQQQFGNNWLLSIAGAGNISHHLMTSINLNQPSPVTVSGVPYDFNPLINTGNYSSAYFAPYLGWANITYYEPIGVSRWNALEVGVRHPFEHNLYMTIAYTWSHNLTNIANVQNPYNIQASYGNSNLNTPHVFTASFVYALPWLQSSSGWKRILLGGWKYSDMTTIQSGNSLTLGLNTAHTGLATRPNQMEPVSMPKTFAQWFSTSSFVQPAPGYYGNVGSGTLLGPGLINFNMALYKDFRITEGTSLEFRSEFFNVLNHTNPNAPSTNLGAGNFGVITSAKDPRIGELALKFRF